MSGALAALAGAGSVSGGSAHLSPAPSWSSIYGNFAGSTNTQTLAGIGSTISITGALSGGGTLYYRKNGATLPYSGAFTAVNGDTLAWLVVVGTGRQSGVLTVTNVSDGGAVIGSINYSVAGNF